MSEAKASGTMKTNPSISDKDRRVLRDLAKRHMEIVNAPEMPERKRQWKALHSLRPERPMLIFEPYWLDGFLDDYEVKCGDKALQPVEQKFMYTIKQYELMGDDIVFEPYFRLGWTGPQIHSTGTDYGEIKIEEHFAQTPGLAYLANFPIQKPDDIKKLTPRTFEVVEEPVVTMKDKLEDIFGDILPVKLENFDNFSPDIGNKPFIGNNFIGITWTLFKLIGAEAMMMWPYDHPNELRALLDFLLDDKKRFFQFMLDNGYLTLNTDNQFAGPSCYGYVDDLPEYGTKQDIGFEDLWTWAESQESESISPEMYSEWYLPYIAELANMFGLSYYGCCERIDDRFNAIEKAIKNLRIFSVSGWTNYARAGELLGKKYVFSRKPIPAYISSPSADWDAIKNEARETWNAAKNGCLEIIFRDVYSRHCTPERAGEWIKIWKQTIGL